MEAHEVKQLALEHDMCKDAKKDFIILPIGFKYNEEAQQLRNGDIIRFLDGSEHYVDSVAKIPVKSAIAGLLCRLRYGIEVDKAVELWKDRLRLQRMDIRAMSKNECLVICYHKKEVEYVRKQKKRF